MNNELWANLYKQKEMTINGRAAWLWLISTAIGNIAIVQYEKPSKEIVGKLFSEHYEQAEAYFETICKKMVSGKL